jgi:hypothetical protein
VSTVDDRAFELWALEVLEGTPTEAWETIGSLWNNLALAEQSVCERIIRRMNIMIGERNDSASATLGRLIAAALSMSPAPKVKGLPYNIAAFRAAAVYNTHRPNASNRQIAKHKSVGVSEKTIRDWKQDYAFEFNLAGQKPGVPDSQIFSPVMREPVSLAGEGKLVVNEQIIPVADRK